MGGERKGEEKASEFKTLCDSQLFVIRLLYTVYPVN